MGGIQEEVIRNSRTLTKAYATEDQVVTVTQRAIHDVYVPSASQDDLVRGKRANNIVIIARGTFEEGNVGRQVGIALTKNLKERFGGDVIIQGVS